MNVARGALVDEPALIEALQSDNRRARFYAAFFLKKLGPDGRPALPILREQLDEADGRSRQSIQEAIDSIEGGAADE